MIKLKGNFSYKYLNTKSVYLISNSKPNKSTLMNYLSVPHTAKEIGSTTNNVIIGFVDKDLCLDVMNEMRNELPKEKLIAVSLPFEEAKYISNLLKLSLVIMFNRTIVNNKTEYEIYYSKYKNVNEK